MQGIKEDGFLGKDGLMVFLEFAPAFGKADATPVGGAISSAAKAGPLDEGFQKDRPIAIVA